jgi:hypothetical protein
MAIKISGKRFRVSTAYWPRREFDPAKVEDMKEYRHFLQKQNWRDGCPFVLEWPFLTITSMVEHKITRYHLSNLGRYHKSK